ncbi:MAG: alginate lyase family protein [Clostridia bacterium]|nr:alginate lyase family protein [Clostridia bacterium]
MQISEFFKIFNLSHPNMDKVNYFVYCNDYSNAKKELLRYFIDRKAKYLSSAEPISERDKNFPLAYISRHGILSGPNEADCYLSSLFVAHSEDYTSLDVLPFLKDELAFMIMSRQKEKEGALLYSPSSIFPPYLNLVLTDGSEVKIPPSKYAYISTKSPSEPLCDEDIYEICEESDEPQEPFGLNTGRVYMAFDTSHIDPDTITSARFTAKISVSRGVTKELFFFRICDSSWDNTLTWDKVKGNVYSWENSPTGPEWISPEGSDSEYLNVTARFWFARPMAYQYLSDTDKNAVYGEKLLFLMDAFSQKKEGGFNRVLETGERLSNFTSVLNALIDTPVMTSDYLVSILYMMYRDMKHLIENPDLGWSNWAVVRTSGLSKAIDFLPELKEHEKWKNSTRSLMDKLFDRMYSPDFSFREAGLAYSFWCNSLFASAVKSAHMNNDPYSAFMRNRIEKAFDASLDFIYPNLYDTNVGDSNYNSKEDYLTTAGSLFPTKKLKALLSGTDDKTIPPSVFYPYSGSVIMRNGFNGENAMYLAMHSIPFDGHAHDDIGNILFYAHNRPLITDTGRYGYSQGEISAHLKTVNAHNTVEIEGYDYLPHSECNAKITRFVSNPRFDYAVSEAKPYKGIAATHKRSVVFFKKEGFSVVSDYITTDTPAVKFSQNWHFMPLSNPECDYNNHISTSFPSGNITLVCPDADTAEIKDDIFSSGYGMAERSNYASFTKYGQSVSMTTLLLPYKDESKRVSSYSTTPEDLSSSSAVFDIESERCVFYQKNSDSSGRFLDCTFDGDMAALINGRLFISNGSTLSINSGEIIASHTPIEDMYIHIASGIIEIDSSSLIPSTKRDEAIKIYAPKTTHVLLNGESIPFTSYSDYVYAVKTK